MVGGECVFKMQVVVFPPIGKATEAYNSAYDLVELLVQKGGGNLVVV